MRTHTNKVNRGWDRGGDRGGDISNPTSHYPFLPVNNVIHNIIAARLERYRFTVRALVERLMS